MRLKLNFIIVLMSTIMVSCINSPDKNAEQHLRDSIHKADSVSAAIEQQRIIDSVNMVSKEQQIIADSISNQVTN